MSRRIVARFGRRIRELRDLRGMNQTALADRIPTKQETISSPGGAAEVSPGWNVVEPWEIVEK